MWALSILGERQRTSGLILVYSRTCVLVQKPTLVLKLYKTQLCPCKLMCKPVGVGPLCKLFLESPEPEFSEHELLWHRRAREFIARVLYLLLPMFLAISAPQIRVWCHGDRSGASCMITSESALSWSKLK